jgi:1-acyl-sn-glycerol-3-phosphate acyltransferase
VIVCLNHPSWWDPLIAITLANSAFKHRSHYAPIDSVALQRYRIFDRLGFFGIDPNSLKGAARFLQTARSILADQQSVLWITAEGSFTDVRIRPVQLRSGAGHLLHSMKSGWVVPLALEYTFWEERCPEALAAWGEPIPVGDGEQRTPAEWTERIARGIEHTSDRLAMASRKREKKAFEVVVSGSAGIGGIYDAWRAFKARMHGDRFVSQHGSEEF